MGTAMVFHRDAGWGSTIARMILTRCVVRPYGEVEHTNSAHDPYKTAHGESHIRKEYKLGSSGRRGSSDLSERGDERDILVRNPFNDPPDGLLEPLAINNSQLACLRSLPSQLRFQRLELGPRRASA